MIPSELDAFGTDQFIYSYLGALHGVTRALTSHADSLSLPRVEFGHDFCRLVLLRLVLANQPWLLAWCLWPPPAELVAKNLASISCQLHTALQCRQLTHAPPRTPCVPAGRL